MAGIDMQSIERFGPDSALVANACHSLSGGSSNPPKFGTLIPNRIFVGGIPSNTTEQELKSFFSSFGQVKDVKIISDRLGVSKGSYGFVTFESQEMAEKIIKNESETLIFKDRKLNIGHAIRKQQMFPRTDLPAALFFAGGAVPYGFQNGMAFVSIPGQEYPVLTQTPTPYATMMLPQAGGGSALYIPSSLHSAVSGTTSPYASLSQQQVAAAALQQQQIQAAGSAVGLNHAVAGQLNHVTTSGANIGAQTNSTAAVMAAAAAAMAAAVQWPPQANNGQTNSQFLANLPVTAGSQSTAAQHTLIQNTSITPQQAAAVAAAMAAQQTAWRWSPVQSQSQVSSHTTSGTNHGANATSTITVNSNLSHIASTPTASNQSVQNNQQGSPTAALGPATYLYSPITGTGHELMFFHQASSPFTANSTSDYSTDHSAHSSGLLESVEPLAFPCESTPLGRHSQLTGQLTSSLANQQFDPNCLPSYAAFAPLLDLQSHTAATGPHNALIQPTNLNQLRHQQHHASTLIAQQAPAQHYVPIAHAATTLLPTQHTKLYTPSMLSAVSLTGQSVGGLLGNTSLKSNVLSDLNSPDTKETAILSQSTANQSSGNQGGSVAQQQAGVVTSQCASVSSTISPETAVGVGLIHR